MDTKKTKHHKSDKHLTDDDYILVDGGAWFTVKGFSVRIHSTDEGVICDVYKLGDEMEGVIASTYACDSELEEETNDQA
ncbi:MAG: hypothetical protein ACRD4C_08095 [Candidatus Acidiferrales bacterium]